MSVASVEATAIPPVPSIKGSESQTASSGIVAPAMHSAPAKGTGAVVDRHA